MRALSGLILAFILLNNCFASIGNKGKWYQSDDFSIVKLDSTINYTWTGIDWKPTDIVLNEFKGSLLYASTTIKAESRIPFTLVVYSYNDVEQIQRLIISYYYQDNWHDSIRYNYSYDGEDNLIEELIQNQTDNIWKNTRRRYNFIYDMEGNLLSNENQFWVGEKWKSRFFHTYTYSDNNLLINRLSVNEVGVTDFIIEMEYNEFDLLSSNSAMRWSPDGLVNWYRNDFLYDNCQNLKETIQQDWQDGNWVNTQKKIRYYSLNNIEYSWRKIPLCHNGHTIIVSHKALKPHLEHGDCIGFCKGYNHVGSNKKSSESVIEDTTYYDGIRIYPNPVEESLWIELNSRYLNPQRIEILDFSGRKVRSHPITDRTNVTLERGNLEAGIYFVRIVGEKTLTRKIILR